MHKVPETVAEAFELAEELLLNEESAGSPEGSVVQAGYFCKLKEELCELRKEAKEWDTKVKDLEKTQQEVECTSDDTLALL